MRNLNRDDSQAIIPTAICKSNIPLIRTLRTWNLPISRADLHDYHFNGRSEEIKRRRARSLSLLLLPRCWCGAVFSTVRAEEAKEETLQRGWPRLSCHKKEWPAPPPMPAFLQSSQDRSNCTFRGVILEFNPTLCVRRRREYNDMAFWVLHCRCLSRNAALDWTGLDRIGQRQLCIAHGCRG